MNNYELLKQRINNEPLAINTNNIEQIILKLDDIINSVGDKVIGEIEEPTFEHINIQHSVETLLEFYKNISELIYLKVTDILYKNPQNVRIYNKNNIKPEDYRNEYYDPILDNTGFPLFLNSAFTCISNSFKIYLPYNNTYRDIINYTYELGHYLSKCRKANILDELIPYIFEKLLQKYLTNKGKSDITNTWKLYRFNHLSTSLQTIKNKLYNLTDENLEFVSTNFYMKYILADLFSIHFMKDGNLENLIKELDKDKINNSNIKQACNFDITEQGNIPNLNEILENTKEYYSEQTNTIRTQK